MAAPTGNSNAKKGKEWFDALRKECVQKDALAKIAAVVVEKAMAGEVWAVTEVANRFDGKPAQSVELTGDPDNPLEGVTRIELVAMRGNGTS
jgi:hypothetical protein